jgi:hypothetical protein
VHWSFASWTVSLTPFLTQRGILGDAKHAGKQFVALVIGHCLG